MPIAAKTPKLRWWFALVLLTSCELVRGRLPGPLGTSSQSDPISTKLSHARTELASLDRLRPPYQADLAQRPHGAHGGFLLGGPGFYSYWARSYCLHAGTSAPARGDGYLLAPLVGQRREVIRMLLRRTVEHPDLPQQRVQELIWAILARASVRSLSAELQTTAATLLTAKELSELEDGAITEMAEAAQARLEESVPAPVRRALETERSLRQTFASGQASYEDLERIAVLPPTGVPGPGSRPVPAGRWSYDAELEAFVAYYPSGYPNTYTELYVPRPIRVQRDAAARIVSLADDHGNRLDVTYADSVAVPGDEAVHAHAFATVRLMRTGVALPEFGYAVKSQWRARGYALLGVPSVAAAAKVAAVAAYPGLAKRHRQAVLARDELDRLARELKRESSGALDDTVRELGERAIALAELEQGLVEVVRPAPVGNADVDGLEDPLFLVHEAYALTVCQYLGGCAHTVTASRDFARALAQANGAPPPLPPLKEFDPSWQLATPADTSRQRLAQSAVPGDPAPAKQCERIRAERNEAERLRDAFSDGALQEKHRFDSGIKSYQEDAISQALGHRVDLTENLRESIDGSAEAGMYTHSSSCLVVAPERSYYERHGWDSGPGYDADLAHEQHHKASCKANQSKFLHDMAQSKECGQEEAAAYQVKIDFLDRWLGEHCQ